MADSGNSEEPATPEDGTPGSRSWWPLLGLIAGVFVLAVIVAKDENTSGPSESYEICAAAAKRNGLTEADSGFLTAVGLCMDRLDKPSSRSITTHNSDERSGSLTRPEACNRFNEIVADFRMTDQQSAVAFGTLARSTADQALAAAIERVANAYERNAPAVSSSEVQSLCP